MDYEYRVIPAPKRLKKIKGVSSTAELFAANLADAINAEAREGWEYVRAEALAAERPRGFFRRGGVVEETVMIFRRLRRREVAREPALREIPTREAASPEPTLRETASREPALRETASREPTLRELPSREPTLRELPTREVPTREARPPEPAEARDPDAARTPPVGGEPTRPLASLFARGESPEPNPRSGTGSATPPLLRPVPRHKPGDKS